MAQQLPLTILAGIALTACATMPATAGDDPELARMLAGKVAGSPQQCISLREARGSTVTRDAIVFRESRRLVYVSSTPGCRTNSLDPILVTREFGSRLCSGDVVTLERRA